MVQLGVFLIPASQHPFYRVASSALGYDIWTQRHTTSTLSGLFDQDSLVRRLAWTPRSGVHCTLTGTALHFEDADRSEIVERLAWIAGRTAPFNLVRGRIDATYRGYPKQLVVTFDSPDGALQRLHRLVSRSSARCTSGATTRRVSHT